MSVVIKYVFIRCFCLLAIKINHGLFSPPSVASHKKPRFSIGKYQRLKKERVNGEIQKLLEGDAEILELKRQLAAQRVQVDTLRTKLHNKEETVRRRKRKVCWINFSVCMLWPLYCEIYQGGGVGGVSSDFKAVDYLYNTVVLRATIA